MVDMTFQGADTDQLRDLASRFTDASGRIEELLTALQGQVHAVNWVGPDADDFRSRYDFAHQRGMSSSAQVTERATLLEEEADEQDATSADDGSGSSTGTTGGNPLDVIRRIFGDGNGNGGGPDLPGWLDKASDAVKFTKDRLDEVKEKVEKAEDRAEDFVKEVDDSSKSLQKKFLKYAPFIGAAPELEEMFAAMSRGETGLAIGNGFEAMWAVAPNPTIEAGSFINDLVKDATGSDRSLLEQFGEAQGNSVAARHGEGIGLQASDLLGLERGSTESNVLKSTAGMTSFAIASGNAITALPNFISGFWNTAND